LDGQADGGAFMRQGRHLAPRRGRKADRERAEKTDLDSPEAFAALSRADYAPG
jgi:hypothetical protein